mgnify:CR=1 FL=1
MIDIKSMTPEEIAAYLKELGQPAFRAKQVFRWLYRGVSSFEEMSDLPKALRQKLAESCQLTLPTVARKQVSARDGTIKYLWQLSDGNCIEREHGVYLLPGGVPHGLRLLCLHAGRPGAQSDAG